MKTFFRYGWGAELYFNFILLVKVELQLLSIRVLAIKRQDPFFAGPTLNYRCLTSLHLLVMTTSNISVFSCSLCRFPFERKCERTRCHAYWSHVLGELPIATNNILVHENNETTSNILYIQCLGNERCKLKSHSPLSTPSRTWLLQPWL